MWRFNVVLKRVYFRELGLRSFLQRSQDLFCQISIRVMFLRIKWRGSSSLIRTSLPEYPGNIWGRIHFDQQFNVTHGGELAPWEFRWTPMSTPHYAMITNNLVNTSSFGDLLTRSTLHLTEGAYFRSNRSEASHRCLRDCVIDRQISSEIG